MKERLQTQSKFAQCLGTLACMMLLFFGLTAQSQAATPLAGTVIGNQASATYTDASNVQRTATSNTVHTIVQPVAGFTLTVSQDKYSTPGGTVYFGHTLTNTGNSVDTFDLYANLVTATSNINGTLHIYADANGDGLPDNFTVITKTTAVPAGGLFQFVVADVLPTTARAGQKDTLTVKGASYIDGSIKTNTDTVTVTSAAVISLTKSESKASGGIGATNGKIRYTFTYTNTGNATATNVTIQDALDTNLAYVTGNKARWSVTGTTALTDAKDGRLGTAPTIDYYTYVAGGVTNIWAQINQVPAGTSGTLSFDVYAATDPANHIIPNVGSVTYGDGATPTPASTTVYSNRVNYTVIPTAATVAVVLDDAGSTTDAAAVAGLTPATGANNDIIDVYSATQGATVVFDNVVHNTGGATDTFNIEPYANATYVNTFPTGTSFLFFKADGATPLMDTNGDGVPDTGPMLAGGVYHVFVKAILPTSASGNNGGNGWKFPLVAISTTLNTVSDPTTDRLYKITASGVDLTNNSAGATAPGNGVQSTKALALAAGAITTGAINPGDSYSFALYVNNNSTVPDSYDLLGSTGTAAFGTVSNMPKGWKLDFVIPAAGTCSTAGATVGQSISNTGVINAGGNKLVCAVVTTPTTQAAGTTNIYFRVKSPTSGSFDIKMDAITVNTLRIININTNNAGQIFPGGSIVYAHIITNAGNVVEGSVAAATAGKSIVGLTLSQTLAAQAWTSVIYWDKNNDGVLDQNDPVVTDLSALAGGSNGASTAAGLDPGESATLFVKVFAPLGAPVNAIDTATITATTTGTIATIAAPAPVLNTDNTTVIAGQVRLVKTQALDATCNGIADTAFATTDLTGKPGQCIIYKITATNAGSANVTSVVVSDATPAFTTYADRAVASCPVGGTPTGAATFGAAATNGAGAAVTPTITGTCGNPATFKATIGTLTPQQSGTLTFNVRINP